ELANALVLDCAQLLPRDLAFSCALPRPDKFVGAQIASYLVGAKRPAVMRDGTNHALEHLERLALGRLHETVEDFADFGIARARFHRIEPARDIGIGADIAVDQLADRGEAGAEIVRDR